MAHGISGHAVAMALAGLTLALMGVGMASADDNASLLFDIEDHGDPGDKAPVVSPWKVVELEPDYGGQWVIAGDVDGDGQPEIVSAENHNVGDRHYTSAVAAQKLDGTVLWRWGDPAIGRKNWHHDVACQIHDWDGDGRNEVVLCAKGSLVELDGATGRERRRFPIPDEATDCLVFCDLAGTGRPQDVLVKTRYSQIWAYDAKGSLLWTVENPGGFPTAHQPRPVDVNGDGRDEILAGYALLNPDGSVRWTFESKEVDLRRGHADCWRVVRSGDRPEDVRLVLTCCGANNIALVDGHGKPVWEVSGHHFESVDVGHVIPGLSRPQFVVDIDHQPFGEGPLWVLDENGKLVARLVTDYSRHHALLDWTGDGADDIVVANNHGVWDHRGRRVATLDMPADARTGEQGYETSILVGDMSGDRVPDIILATPRAAYIFRNEHGKPSPDPVPLGTEPNFTLY